MKVELIIIMIIIIIIMMMIISVDPLPGRSFGGLFCYHDYSFDHPGN